MNKTVTVFGSSIPLPGELEYESAYKLGKILGSSRINVCTGGFLGIMEAVSKGAAESGTEAIGITVNIFNARPNKYLTKEIRCASLFERLSKLIENGDAYIILNGGTGTLLELSLVWELINKNLIDAKPCAALGNMWNLIISEMEKQIIREKRKNGLIYCCDSVEDCAAYIIEKLQGKI